jgi:hypothetical protein
MIIFFSVLGVVILLFILFSKPGVRNVPDNYYREDSNYADLKKLFFYPGLHNFDWADKRKIDKVFGVLIESENQLGEKILFATYINGYAGFYKNRGGGCLGGKYYHEGAPDVQDDINRVIGRNGSVSDFLSKEIRDKATAFTILANDYLSQAELDSTWYGGNSVVTFWLLTEEGPYQWRVPQVMLYYSPFKDLACAANDIISDLRNSEECLREDPMPRYEELKL